MRHCFLLTLVNGRLNEPLQMGIGGGMIEPAASEVGVSVQSIIASQTVTIEDMETGTLTVEVGAKDKVGLIDSGKKDASNTPDDWEDPDAEACAALEVEVK